MNLEELNISNFDGLIGLENANVNTQAFYKIIEIVKLSLRKLDIIPEGLQLYYQRNIDTTSILAIQVIHGEYNDIDNYMFNGSKAWQHGSNVNCDVYMHSEAKSAQISMKLASLISNNIVEFFEEIERDLLKKITLI